MTLLYTRSLYRGAPHEFWIRFVMPCRAKHFRTAICLSQFMCFIELLCQSLFAQHTKLRTSLFHSFYPLHGLSH